MSGHSTATSDEESSSPERNNYSGFGITPNRKRKHSNDAQLSSQSSQFSCSDSSSSSSSESESESSPTKQKLAKNNSGIAYSNFNHSSISRNKEEKHDGTRIIPKAGTAYSNFSQKYMAKMGYEEGKGLGARAQGIVEPVEASSQRGRRGLGLEHPEPVGIDEAIPFNAEDEIIEVHEEIIWLRCPNHDLEYDEIKKWYVEGPRKNTIDDETDFIDRKIWRNILKSKTIFDNIKAEDMRRARMNSNPFETIRGAFFLNRAAVKMANMDARNDFMFTSPKNRHNEPAVKENELLYFADVCAGPGGFSEYVLWRKKWYAKGFGFTLKGSNDFKLSDFLAGSPETFDTYYGVDGDGDVFKPHNIDSFQNYVLERTDGYGVHFMMADGGFSVEGQENIQEILSKQLYLCQCIVALYIVREEGHFVVKLFDLVTRFSMGLMFLMYHAFEEICIMKPNTSRPANSERYLLCKWRRKNVDGIAKYLFKINKKLFNYPKNHSMDINEIVPMEIMQEDQKFMNYFIDSNNKLGQKQIVGLSKIVAYCKDLTLRESRQTEMRNKCLQAWNVENRMRSRNGNQCSNAALSELQEKMPAIVKRNLLRNTGNMINTIEDVEKFVGKLPTEKYFMFLSRGKVAELVPPTFFLGTGGTRIFQYVNNSWSQILSSTEIKLPAGTLIYGELTVEYHGEFKSQTFVTVLHIIDALFLGKEPVYELNLMQRIEKCELFTKAIMISNRKSVRVKKLLRLENFRTELGKLQIKYMKGGSPAMAVPLPSPNDQEVDSSYFYVPRGLIFLNPIGNGWDIAWSKSNRKIYYHRPTPRESTFTEPLDLYSNICDCFEKRAIWLFDSSIQCLDDETADQHAEPLHAHDIMKFYHQIQE